MLYIAKDPVTLLSERVYAHRLGADPAQDRLVYAEPDHSYYISVGRSRSEQYLFIYLESTEQTEWRYARADDPALRFDVVLPRAAHHEYQVEQLGADFILRTNWQAPNFRIVRVPIASRADRSAWRDVLPQRADAFVQSFEVADDFIAVNERSGGLMKLRIRPWNGSRDVLVEAGEPAYTMSLDGHPRHRQQGGPLHLHVADHARVRLRLRHRHRQRRR